MIIDKKLLPITTVALMTVAHAAIGQTILQDSATGANQILAASPIGQTFTAESSQLDTIAFSFDDFNSSRENGETTMLLYEGVGTTGTLLGSTSQILTEGLRGEFVDFDFSDVTLVEGQTYTVIVERPNVRWGVEVNQHSFPGGDLIDGFEDYTGGDAILGGNISYIHDLRFRVVHAVVVDEESGEPIEVIIVVGPDAEQARAILAASSASGSRIIVADTRGVIRDRISSSFAARSNAMTVSRASSGGDDGSVVVSTKNVPGMMGNVYTWVELNGFYASDDATNRRFRGTGLQIGADVEIANNVILGFSIGADDISNSIGSASQEGTLVFAQPYLGYRSGAWAGEATLLYGQGEYDQDHMGFTGKGDTTLKAITFSGGYDIDYAGAIITPTIGFALGRDEIEGTSGFLAGAGKERIDFEELSLGARYTRGFEGGTYFVGLHADYLNTDGDTRLVSDLLVDDGWTGRLELGGIFDLDDGMRFEASVEFKGLGGDLQQTSGALRLAYRF